MPRKTTIKRHLLYKVAGLYTNPDDSKRCLDATAPHRTIQYFSHTLPHMKVSKLVSPLTEKSFDRGEKNGN